MKKIILTLGISFVGLNTFAQNVTIPDIKFRNALIAKGVDTNNDSVIQTSEALAVTRLFVTNKAITNLTGIEAFTNLTYLACDTNKLTGLDVHTNVLLDTLTCSNNKIAGLLDVSALTSLVKLYTPYNYSLTGFKGSNTPSIKWMDIGGTIITSLDLSAQTELLYLDVVYTPTTSLIFGNNTKLTTVLAMNSSKLLSLDLSLNTGLKSIDLTTAIPIGPTKPAMTIYVNETQNASIPTGWAKNSVDKYVLKSSVGIDELSAPLNAKKVVRVYNLEGQEVNINDANQGIFFYEYNDGSVKKIAKFN